MSEYLFSPVSIYSLSRQWQDIPDKRQILRSTRDHSTISWSLSHQTTAKKKILKKETDGKIYQRTGVSKT